MMFLMMIVIVVLLLIIITLWGCTPVLVLEDTIDWSFKNDRLTESIWNIGVPSGILMMSRNRNHSENKRILHHRFKPTDHDFKLTL